ncbi:iron chelate uptake ABC transporter family permease subunit [Phyllobacterium sp. 0TCS1.6C]|uniref:FecCD family ABC transporter permease n=2 Tax=unclassified Phyllobacterium TaxID=2638441 RepID=UPI002263EA64|nr:iron chelate uptake ABC transporter family permease subunit [Phyllobacterium sp. 0TCS1.6C]MCX8282099.1 iron chelate uptake ABC transporter family permease subunit [Phyllobacterium sp. 0TCS1.6C]
MRRRAILMASCLALVLLVLLSLAAGTRPVSVPTVFHALIAYDAGSAEHIAVRDYRLPRTLLGLLCGAAFGVSGALIQATTRNPLADPGLLGVNAGAAFFVTLAAGFLGLQSTGAQLWFAFLGAIVVTVLVYAIGSGGRQGSTPIRLLLAGVAVTSILSGIGSAITLLDPVAFDSMRVWLLGTLAGRDMNVVLTVAPFIVAGLVIAALISPALNSIALGDDNARALGTDINRTRLLAAISVTLLAGAGTAAAGPIGFIGLMAPHVARWLLGPDQRLIVAGTMVFAPILLLAADIMGRFLLQTGELEVGIVTAFLGAPILILLVRRAKASGL